MSTKLGNPTSIPLSEDENQAPSFSLALVETIFLAILLVVGAQAPLTIAAQQWGLPFQIYLYLSLLLTALCLLAVAWMELGRLRRIPIAGDDKLILGCLGLLGLLCALVALFTHVAYADDYYYAPNVIYFLGHLSQAMDYGVHFLVGSSGNPVISYSQGTSVAFDYFRGTIAYFTHVKFLAVYYLTDPFAAFLLPAAHFLLLSRFVSRPRVALTGTFIALALILISVDGFAFGFQVPWTMAEGKRFFLIVLVPLFVAFSVSFLARPSWRNWIFLTAITLAAISMTASAANLLPVLALTLTAAFFLTTRLETGHLPPWKSMILRSGFYFTTLVSGFLYVLLLYVQVYFGEKSGDPLALPGPHSFLDQLNIFSSPTAPFYLLTPALIVITPILLAVLVKGWQAKFILLWTVLLAGLFINPLVAPVMMNTIVIREIYWRLFFLAPFPLAGSLVAVASPSRRLTIPLASALMAGALLAYLVFAQTQNILGFSVYDLPLDTLDTARQIATTAPAGVMLVPMRLNGIIPMVDGFHPQIEGDYFANRFWLAPKDVELRENAATFAGGKPVYLGSFRLLLRQKIVRTVVLDNSLFDMPAAAKIQNILQRNGFVHQEVIGGYLVAWK